MSYTLKDVIDTWTAVRKSNSTIPDECLDTMRDVLIRHMDEYPLPDSMYPGSKDWVQSNYAGRVEWLHEMYESRKNEFDRYLELWESEPHEKD